MTSITDLHRTVQAALTGKRVGQPVFVRYLYLGSEPADKVASRLAKISHTVGEWLGQPVLRVYAIGSAQEGQVTVTLEGTRGGTALITFGRDPQRSGVVDVTVLGNRGAIYQSLDRGETFVDAEPTANNKTVDLTLLTALEKSLRSGKPETLTAGGVP